MIANPTELTYGSLTDAYNFFNDELFGGKLPSCLVTLQRHKGAYGYFSGERFASLTDPKQVTDEIAMNPTHFADRSAKETLSTLVHEMAHLWQHHFGKRPRGGYHDRQWAQKMHELGLSPTSTGYPGGKETGQRVTHMIDAGGAYDRAYSKFARECGDSFHLFNDRACEVADKSRTRKAASKTKFTCPTCEANAWGKPDLNLMCGECEQRMTADE